MISKHKMGMQEVQRSTKESYEQRANERQREMRCDVMKAEKKEGSWC